MVRLEEVFEVERPQAECFRYLADFSTIEQWDPGVYRAHKATPGPVAPGTVFDLVLNSAGQRLPMTYTLLELEAPSRMVLRGEAERVEVLDTITLAPAGPGRTRIHYRADLSFRAGMNWMEPALRPWLVRVGRKAVEGMARALVPLDAPLSPHPLEGLSQRLVLPHAWSFTERGYLAMAHKGLSRFLDGQTAVVTGPTSGLGLATAQELARLGARVVLVGRDAGRLEAARQAVLDFAGVAQERVEVVVGELSLLAQVREVAAELRERFGRIDVLVNNAGALFERREETSEGFERALAINLLSPYVLTCALAGALGPQSRVINVASGGMYTQALHLEDMGYEAESYDGPRAYARAKRALVALTARWARAGGAAGPQFHAMHPGWANTPGVEKSLPGFYRMMGPFLRDGRMGADTIVWLACARLDRRHSGAFWLDRQPRPMDLVPGTATSDQQVEELLAWLEKATGVPSPYPR